MYPLRKSWFMIQRVFPPSTKKQLRSLFIFELGRLLPYVCPKFCIYWETFNRLEKKGAPNILVWTEAQDQAIRMLKQCICKPPVLRLPDVIIPSVLQTDASCDGIGAVLLQEEEHMKHPATFGSKKLLPASGTTLSLSVRPLLLCGVFRNLRVT